jgi:hypothetical protein
MILLLPFAIRKSNIYSIGSLVILSMSVNERSRIMTTFESQKKGLFVIKSEKIRAIVEAMQRRGKANLLEEKLGTILLGGLQNPNSPQGNQTPTS